MRGNHFGHGHLQRYLDYGHSAPSWLKLAQACEPTLPTYIRNLYHNKRQPTQQVLLTYMHHLTYPQESILKAQSGSRM